MISDRVIRFLRVAGLAAILGAPAGFAGEVKPLVLPPPQTNGGKPLMQALQGRRSARAFRPDRLSPQTLSNLLWAAFGVSSSDGRRTAPSAMNWQEVDIYVASADGLYLFEPDGHKLRALGGDDIRAQTGSQDFVRDAAVNLIYVADYAKMGQTPEQDKLLFSSSGTGFIAENVYLYCSSEGLATVIRATLNREALAKTMRLRPEQKITLVQSVGIPK
jgi:SagB-type dehydrogenase family enzyme